MRYQVTALPRNPRSEHFVLKTANKETLRGLLNGLCLHADKYKSISISVLSNKQAVRKTPVIRMLDFAKPR